MAFPNEHSDMAILMQLKSKYQIPPFFFFKPLNSMQNWHHCSFFCFISGCQHLPDAVGIGESQRDGVKGQLENEVFILRNRIQWCKSL